MVELHLRQSGVNGRLGGSIISAVKGVLLPLSSSHSSTTRPSRYGILCLAIARRSLSKFPLRNLERQIKRGYTDLEVERLEVRRATWHKFSKLCSFN